MSPCDSCDALRAERDAAVADLARLRETVAFMEKEYLAGHGGAWGVCKYQVEVAALTADNERLRVALIQADATLHSIRGWYLEDMPAPGWEELRERDRLKMESAMLVARAALASLAPQAAPAVPVGPQRCGAIGPASERFQCGLQRGHGGAHTALIPTGAPWLDAPRATEGK